MDNSRGAFRFQCFICVVIARSLPTISNVNSLRNMTADISWCCFFQSASRMLCDMLKFHTRDDMLVQCPVVRTDSIEHPWKIWKLFLFTYYQSGVVYLFFVRQTKRTAQSPVSRIWGHHRFDVPLLRLCLVRFGTHGTGIAGTDLMDHRARRNQTLGPQ